MSDYIPASLRQLVVERAAHRCEYCRFPQAAGFLTFEIDHIIAKKHRGLTIAENLALACPVCNSFKGSDIASLDPQESTLTALFNPRTQEWQDHFQLTGAHIIGNTAVGRVTVALLQFNLPERITERELLIVAGMYP